MSVAWTFSNVAKICTGDERSFTAGLNKDLMGVSVEKKWIAPLTFFSRCGKDDVEFAAGVCFNAHWGSLGVSKLHGSWNGHVLCTLCACAMPLVTTNPQTCIVYSPEEGS